MTQRVTLHRTDGAFHFVGRNAAGMEVHFDTAPAEGGSGQGVGPMQSVAMALGACSAIDVVNILRKARQDVAEFDVEIDYVREQEEVPAVFVEMHVHYLLEGDVDPEKVRRAVELSVTKYCSVSKMLSKTASITHSFSVNGTRYD